MNDTKTISMASSELNWDDVEKDSEKAGFKTISRYVQYCVEYFHDKNNRKIFSRITPTEFYMIFTTTILVVMMGVLLWD